MRVLGKDDYLDNAQNYIDLVGAITLLIAVFYDFQTSADSVCILFYGICQVFVFLLLVKKLMLMPNFSFILQMIFFSISDLWYFILTELMLIVFFMF